MRCINRWFRPWNCNVDGHKFEGRYNSKFPEGDYQMRGMHPSEIMEKTYVRDVCIHCGKVIENGS